MGGSEKKQLIANGKRLSGRGFEDLREISAEVGVLEKASGSALVKWGKNIVLAAVYGPREVFPKHLMNLERAIVSFKYAMAPFSSLEEHGRAGPNRRAIEIGKVAKHVFENTILVNQFPKTQVEISVEILQSDGGTRIAGVTAAALALVDAGIPVKDIVQGVSIGKVEGELIVDLDKDEDNFGAGDVPIAVSLRNGEVLLFQLDGMYTRDEFAKIFDLAFRGCEKVKAVQVDALMKKYSKGQDEVAPQNGN